MPEPWQGSIFFYKQIVLGKCHIRIKHVKHCEKGLVHPDLLIIQKLPIFSSQVPISFQKRPSFSQLRGVIAHSNAAK